MEYVAIDFETFYSKEYSIAGNSTWWYVHQPDFDPYLVTLANDDMEFVGQPADFDWKRVEGMMFVAHNASFDQRVFERAQEMGIIPDVKIAGWECSAALSTYCQMARPLASAVKAVFGEDLSKAVRDSMKGRTWDMMLADDTAEEVMEYALDDAKWAWKLWKELSPHWPEAERKISKHTRYMAWRGFPINVKSVEDGKDRLEKSMFEAKNNLPWYDEIDPDTKKPYVIYSKKALGIECRKKGIEPPKSLAQDSDECKKWMAEHGSKFEFVADMQNYARMNTHAKRLKAMERRLTPADRMSYNLKYWGADITGRWSGDAGFNVQNMPRDAKYGVDIRACMEAPEGKTFVIADLSQIEPRCLAYMVDDWDFLELVAQGISPYEAHARQTMGWTGGTLSDEDKTLYLLAKVRVLQLGYGCGWHRFYETVRDYGQLHILENDIDANDIRGFKNFAGSYQPIKLKRYDNEPKKTRRHWVNAFIQVSDYRDKNPRITEEWSRHNYALKQLEGEDYQVSIPSGRALSFFNVRAEVNTSRSCKSQKGGRRRMNIYGANVFQNMVQGCARDVMAQHIYDISDSGYDIVLHVHDEVVVEVDEKDAETAKEDIMNIMAKAPDWLEGCPLDSEALISKQYTK